MRRVSLILIALIALATLPASADQLRREREERGAIDRFVRVVKSVLRMHTNGDILLPPLPAPRP